MLSDKEYRRKNNRADFGNEHKQQEKGITQKMKKSERENSNSDSSPLSLY